MVIIFKKIKGKKTDTAPPSITVTTVMFNYKNKLLLTFHYRAPDPNEHTASIFLRKFLSPDVMCLPFLSTANQMWVRPPIFHTRMIHLSSITFPNKTAIF